MELKNKTSMHSILAEILVKAKLTKFEQDKKKEIVDMATYTPMFIVPHFVKALFYHVMYMMVLGPMLVPFLLIFESWTAIKYMGFVPSTNPDGCFYFVV